MTDLIFQAIIEERFKQLIRSAKVLPDDDFKTIFLKVMREAKLVPFLYLIHLINESGDLPKINQHPTLLCR